MVWVIIIFVVVLLLKNKKQSTNVQYKKHKVLFTPAERSFPSVLNHAIEGNAVIFVMVRVADIINPIGGLPRNKWKILFNKISSKHFGSIFSI